MDRFGITGERALALLLLAFLLLNPPILSIFDIDAQLWGIPLPFFFLFAAWGLLILLVALHAEHSEIPGSRPQRGTSAKENSTDDPQDR